jgi:hypothetical protein
MRKNIKISKETKEQINHVTTLIIIGIISAIITIVFISSFILLL